MKRHRGDEELLGQKRTTAEMEDRGWAGPDKRTRAQEVQKRTKTGTDKQGQKRSRGEEMVLGQKRERGQGESKRAKEMDQLKRIRVANREPD